MMFLVFFPIFKTSERQKKDDLFVVSRFRWHRARRITSKLSVRITNTLSSDRKFSNIGGRAVAVEKKVIAT